MRYRRWPWLALTAVLTAGLSQAGMLPHWGLRELAIRSDTVVLAEPLDPLPVWKPGQERAANAPAIRYKVVEILRSATSEPVKPGEVLEIRMDLYRLGDLWVRRDKQPPPPPRIGLALLYLGQASGASTRADDRLVLSGIRLRTDKEVLAPWQLMNPGGYYFRPLKDWTWEQLVKRAREEIHLVEPVRALQNIGQPAERAAASLAWIRKHIKELHYDFSGSPFVEARQQPGWGSLGRNVFAWVLQSYRPADCWEALVLHQQAYGERYPLPDIRGPFASKEGRQLLATVAFSEGTAEHLRLLALNQLADSSNLWPHPQYRGDVWVEGKDDDVTLSLIDKKEQAELLDSLLPLLKHSSARIRGAAGRAIATTSRSYDHVINVDKQMETARALPSLVAAHRSEQDADARRDLEGAIKWLAGENRWRALTQPAR